MVTDLSPKIPIFECKCCDYFTSNKKDFSKHNNTIKHKKRTLVTECDVFVTDLSLNPQFTCEKCFKKYNSRNGLWSHKKKCKEISTETEQCSNNIIMEILKQNHEFKELIVEQNKQILEQNRKLIEFAEKGQTTNNITNNNTNNNQFNLQFFLNETCKDALNIGDFVEQVKLQLSDLDMIGRVGYVEGITKIFLRNLKDMDVCKRPIHCSDLKRETLYVKDKNSWEKENGENIKIKRAIKEVEHKNIKQIPQWRQENPTAEDTETKKHMEYQNILLEAMGGSTSEDDNKKCEKIIRNIAKEVVIEKK
jgi:hypothetical protein